MTSSSDSPAQLALYQDRSGTFLEGVALEGSSLRAERMGLLERGDAISEIVSVFAPPSKFEYREHIPFGYGSPRERFGDFANVRFQLRESLSLLGGTELPGRVSGPFPQNLQYNYAIHVARRRRISRFLHLTFASQGCAVCASDTRGNIANAACDFWDVMDARAHFSPARVCSVGETLRAIIDQQRTTQNLCWIATGENAGEEAPAIAAKAGANSLLIPAHAGAAAALGVLLGDVTFHSTRYARDGVIPGGQGLSQYERLRVIMLELMDKVAKDVTKAGFDLDDTVSLRYLSARTTDGIPKYFTYTPASNNDTDPPMPWGAESCEFMGAGVIATVEIPKSQLPPIAVSQTISGGGVPEKRVVNGPGRMHACLSEIDVPAGWRAEWEPCGDVVMTRV